MFNFAYKNIDFAHKLDKPSSPTEEYYKHMHSFSEIIYFVRGKMDFTIESETRTVHANDLVYIAPGKYHFATVDSSVPYERYVLKFPDTLIPDFIKNKLFSSASFYGNALLFAETFERLDSYAKTFSGDELYSLLACEVIKLVILMLNKKPVTTSFGANKFIDQIINYIEVHIKEPITLDILVKEFNFSKSYISNEFKKQMKIPIMHYVRSKKIIAAHQMILKGYKKSEVAEMYGFENYSTFYRAYQQMIKSEMIVK